jgi:hypothetical protein
MKKAVFVKRIRINHPVETVFRWHARPGALERMSPPWDPLTVISRRGGIQRGARVELKMRAGPVPFRWIAEHTDYEENRRFTDMQVSGPLAHWAHTHTFEADGPKASILEDKVSYAPRFGAIGGEAAVPFIRRKLQRIFAYRHETLIRDLHVHQYLGLPAGGKYLISGAGGVVGSVLVPFFTTGGHRVVQLVRVKTPSPSAGVSPATETVYWNPAAGIIEAENPALSGVDAVIHLAGENIGQGRWTKEKKRRIMESRVQGTRLLAETAARMKPRPPVFVSASAVGYYGNRDDCLLTEADACGGDFISEVCEKWEGATAPAADAGIRVVHLRIGVALTPAGGALKLMRPWFQAGLGGRLGPGTQYVSWIGIDDVVDAIGFAIGRTSLEGAVNVVSPNPVTNNRFTEILGTVLQRPTLLPVPAAVLKAAFGEMGREVPLSSTRVLPEALMQAGFTHRYPALEEALRHLLGKR